MNVEPKSVVQQNYLNNSCQVIHEFMAWNGDPRHVRRNIIRNFDQNRHTSPINLNEQQLDEKDDVPAI